MLYALIDPDNVVHSFASSALAAYSLSSESAERVRSWDRAVGELLDDRPAAYDYYHFRPEANARDSAEAEDLMPRPMRLRPVVVARGGYGLTDGHASALFYRQPHAVHGTLRAVRDIH